MRDFFTPLFLGVTTVLILENSLQTPAAIWQPLFGIFFLSCLALFVLRLYRACYILGLLSLCALLLSIFTSEREQYREQRNNFPAYEDYVDIRGILTNFPEIHNDGFIIFLKSREIKFRGKRKSITRLIRIKVQGKDPGLHRGDELEIAARIYPIHLQTNFTPNPMETYFHTRGIHGQGFCKSPELIRCHGRASPFWKAIGHWRKRIRTLIDHSFLKDSRLENEGVFMEAIILGDRGRLENSTREELIRSGVLHFIAISGANIAMIAWMTLLFLRISGFKLRNRYLITIPVLLLFLVLSGLDISAQRAVLMAVFIFLSRILFRRPAIFAPLSLAGLTILAIHPADSLDPGFILTFALTFAIIMGWQAFSPLFPRTPNWLKGLAISCLSAGIVALPLSLHFFQRYSISGILTSMLLVPLTTIATGAGLLLIPICWMPIAAGTLILSGVDPILQIFFWIIRTTARWFPLEIQAHVSTLSPALTVLISLAFLARISKKRMKLFLLPLPFLLILMLILPRPRLKTGFLDVYFLDVGQGDCEIIVFPTGEALMIDGGGSALSDFPVGTRIVLPFLLKTGIRIKWMIVSHFHPDHVRGILDLLPLLHPQEIWIGPAPVENGDYQRLLRIKPDTTRLLKIGRGWGRQCGGWDILVLHPEPDREAVRAENDDSLVVRISNGNTAFLFTGDIERKSEMELLEYFPESLQARILKTAHHGSRTSSSQEFLSRVKPDLAIISAARGNSFGFPHPEVRKRLQHICSGTLETSRHGGIRISIINRAKKIEVSRSP